MDKKRILIIDDDVFVRKTLKRALGAFDLTLAEDGEQAIEILATAEPFDVILCDLMMPGVNGIDVYEHLRRAESGQERVMVFLTGGSIELSVSEFLNNLDNLVIEKPFDFHRLRGAIDEMLESS